MMIPKNREVVLATIEAFVEVKKEIANWQGQHASKDVPHTLHDEFRQLEKSVPYQPEEWVKVMNSWRPRTLVDQGGYYYGLNCRNHPEGKGLHYIHDQRVGFVTGQDYRQNGKWPLRVIIAGRILLPNIGLACGCCDPEENTAWLGETGQLLLFAYDAHTIVGKNAAFDLRMATPTTWWFKEFFDHAREDEENPNLIVVDW